jgi:hypothetical protein
VEHHQKLCDSGARHASHAGERCAHCGAAGDGRCQIGSLSPPSASSSLPLNTSSLISYSPSLSCMYSCEMTWCLPAKHNCALACLVIPSDAPPPPPSFFLDLAKVPSTENCRNSARAIAKKWAVKCSEELPSGNYDYSRLENRRFLRTGVAEFAGSQTG